MKHTLAAGCLAVSIAPSPAPSAEAAAKVLRAVIENIQFAQTPEEAHIGDAVEWLNKDFVDHTATAKDGSFDVTVPGGKVARIVLTQVGTIAFFCRYHPNMTGEIRVRSQVSGARVAPAQHR